MDFHIFKPIVFLRIQLYILFPKVPACTLVFTTLNNAISSTRLFVDSSNKQMIKCLCQVKIHTTYISCKLSVVSFIYILKKQTKPNTS